MEGSNEIEIFTEGDISLPFKDLSEDFVCKASLDTLKHLELENVSISLILSDNEYIHTINKEYRKKDNPTDVISFAYREDPFPEIETEIEELGDIYLSLEKALEQSIEYEVTLEDEVKRLLIHGILHLIGFDHEKSDEDEKTMRDKEEEILNAI